MARLTSSGWPVEIFDARAHAHEVVLDQPDDRQIPDCAQVEQFVEVAIVAGPVAEEAEYGVRLVVIAHLEGDTGRQRQVTADDGVAAPEVQRSPGHVHRAALATAHTGPLAHHLGHEQVGAHAARNGDAMIAVGSDDVVIRPQRFDGAQMHGFVAAGQMQVDAGDAALFVWLIKIQRSRHLLELADQHHFLVPREQSLSAQGLGFGWHRDSSPLRAGRVNRSGVNCIPAMFP